MSTPGSVELIDDPLAPATGRLVITGYTQGAHGRVTLLGSRATYTPTPGYAGQDRFRYTISDAAGNTSTASVSVVVAATTPACTITISGPGSAIIGPAIHLTATATCNFGTPEIQWLHRLAGGTFSIFKSFSTATTADFVTTSAALGDHQFEARVRIQGTTTRFTSNIITVKLLASDAPCTAVVLDAPPAGAVFATGQTIALGATATCPAGVTPELQYWVKQAGDASFTVLPGYFSGASSFTPPQAGDWEFAAAARAVGATEPFQVQSPEVAVKVSHTPSAVDDTLVVDEDQSGTVNVLANDVDPDGDTLTATITTSPAAGTATIADGIVSYQPAANYHGDDAIGYTVSDGRGNTASATVHVTVNPLNDAPSANHDFLTVAEDGTAALDVTRNDTDIDGDTLSVTAVSSPAHGTASFDGAVVSYAPDPDYNGADRFEYTISDGQGGSSSASVFVTVTAANDAPVAVDDELACAEDTTGVVFVLGNDSDPDGDAPTVVGFDQPAHGSVVINAGFAAYSPLPDYNGPDEFHYTVQDAAGATSTATVHVTVLPVNDPPVAAGDSASLDEDTSVAIDVAGNDTDLDGDVLAVASVTQPAHGSAAIASGHEITYTPAADYHGPDSFSYTIADPSGATATATVTLEIASVNDAPVAAADAASLDEDTSAVIDVVTNDSDVDGDALAITAITQPGHGAATIVDATHVSYTPAADYHGPDGFSYTIADGHGGEAGAAVAITVNPVNDAPVAADDSAALDEDTTATIDVAANDSDIDGDALAITAVSQPAHGAVAIVDATHVSYTPAADYNGPDGFSYTIGDGNGGEAGAAVAITVNPVNDAPVARDDAADLAEDASAVIDVVANDSDIDGDALAIASVTPPAHGAATILDASHVAYTPAPNYHGGDAFSYTIIDPSGAQATALVVIEVASVDDAPLAADDAASLDEDTAVTVDVVANDFDIDGDALAITGITQPAHGVATVVDGRVLYVPAPNYHGPDGLSYTISDGNGGQATAELALDVISVNDAPVAVADAASLAEDTSATIDVVANDSDIDGDALAIAIAGITQPAHGVATVADATHVTYTPAPNFHGGDAFSYTITDPAGAQATAQVAVEVTGVNDAPLANDDAASVDEDAAVTADVVANDFDVDGDDLAIASITQPAHGLATVVDGHRVQYVPAPDYHGPDALSYTISDGHGGQATAQLVLDVISVNDAPVAVADAASLDEDTAATLDVVGNDSDIDGDTLAVAGVTQPGHGTAAIAGLHQVSYTPAADYHGPDSFSYTIDDGHGAQATATVTIDVIGVNDAPVAADDAASLDEDTLATVDVAGNDSDVDGDALAIASVTQPAHGAAAIADDHHVSYTPAADFHGTDSFQYTIGDGQGGQATATVTLSVASVNDAPVATDAAVSTFDDTAVTASFAASDVDGDSLGFAIATPPAHGTLGPVIGDHVVYTPAPGFAGSDAFTYTASDGQASSAPATVAVTVVRSVCGNGVREGREECDDGNATPGDGCEATCKLTCGSGTGAERATVDAASGHCFAAYDGVRGSYQEAAAMCAAFGGHLPTITSAGEDAAAHAAVSAGDTPWLGADDIAAEGTFGWTTGERFSDYNNFAAGKPDNAGNADCVQYLADGTWSDTPCSGASVTGTVCELELAVATPAVATGGGGTRAIAVADFNGDGFADLAAVNPGNNTVGVLLGNGAGGFALQATYATGANPVAIGSGDFDGDGRLDLAVVNATANTVSVLRGTGSGGFVAGATVAIATGATSIAVADLDQDGVLDLAVAASSTVQVLRGDGGGGFTALGAIAVTGVPAAIAAGDFDRDGRVDLALTTPAAVLVVMGTGGGAFGLPVTLAASTNNRAIIARDLDGDGNLDLAVASGASSVTLWFGTASGVFGAPSGLTVPGTPLLVAAGDFDGDGGSDVVAVTAGFAALFHGAGRTFTPAGALVGTGGSGASSAAVAGVNADAAADLVVANGTTSNVGILLGGPGGFAGARALPVGTASAATVSGDFNEDGRSDLAVIDPAASKVFVFVQDAAGGLVPSATVTLVSGAGASYGVTADFDGDGHVDIAIVNANFSSISVLLGAGNGTFGAPLNTGTAQTPRRAAVGDFNGDGKPDLAVPSSAANAVSILINAGGGRFGHVSDLPAGAAPAAAVVGDFNGDGKKDIAIATTGEASVKLLLGNGNTTFGAAVAFPVASAGQSIAAGDLDGDGKLDLAVTGTTTASVSILRGTGTGGFAAATSVAVGTQPSSVVAVDLDGDARLDLVVGNAGTNDVTVLHGNGGGGFVGSSFGLGVPPAWVCVADFDRDGHLDIATASSSAFVTTLYSGR